MTDLVTWLREQIDEDEAVAKAATPGPWRAFTTGVRGGDHWHVYEKEDGQSIALIHANDGEDEGQRGPDATHIARHDPARVLAEVAAQRRIVELLGSVIPASSTNPIKSDDTVALAEWTLRLLAQSYADRPGFREEWRS